MIQNLCTATLTLCPIFAAASLDDAVSYRDGNWRWINSAWVYDVGEGWHWINEAQVWVYVHNWKEPINPAAMTLVEGGNLPVGSIFAGTVVADFKIGNYEVTWGEWKRVRAWAADNGYDIGELGVGCADDHPVYMLSWFDVLKWCNAKSEWEELTPVYMETDSVYRSGEPEHSTISQNISADGYRLPQEVEWEFAARGGNLTQGHLYAGSSTFSSLPNFAWFSSNSKGATCDLYETGGTWPVGQKEPNELGLYDMSGNVWEWCWDRWNETSSHRLIRGGSWLNGYSFCEVSHRSFNKADQRFISYGFRLAQSVVQ